MLKGAGGLDSVVDVFFLVLSKRTFLTFLETIQISTIWPASKNGVSVLLVSSHLLLCVSIVVGSSAPNCYARENNARYGKRVMFLL